MVWVNICANLVSIGDFGFNYNLCSLWHTGPSVFGHIHVGRMWELWDGEAICFWLISLFLSVCWLEKLMRTHGVFLAMYAAYSLNKYCAYC